jgi:choline kinase
VRVSRERDIVEIGKEVAPARALGESIGIERFSGEFLAQLFEVLERKVVREGRVQEFYEAAFQEVISAGERVAAIDVGTLPCIEIDTQEDLERARTEIIPLLDRDRSNRLKTQRP